MYVFCPGTPSSSYPQAPLLLVRVPSSTTLTPFGHTLVPIFSENIDCPFLLKSASNACPMASWSNTPDGPAPITTLIWPPFGLMASKRSSMPLTASVAISSISNGEISSAPILKLLDMLLFSVLPSCWNTTVTDRLPIGLVSQVISPNELYMSTSLTESESLAMTFTMRLSFAVIFFSSSSRNGRNADACMSLQFCCIG